MNVLRTWQFDAVAVQLRREPWTGERIAYRTWAVVGAQPAAARFLSPFAALRWLRAVLGRPLTELPADRS